MSKKWDVAKRVLYFLMKERNIDPQTLKDDFEARKLFLSDISVNNLQLSFKRKFLSDILKRSDFSDFKDEKGLFRCECGFLSSSKKLCYKCGKKR